MANEEVLGPRKTMFVLVIVVGCFAVLWPRIISPLILGQTRDQLKPNQFDRDAGCCEVIFETEMAVLELINEVCNSATHAEGRLSPYAAAECRKAVNETCGLDIAAFLKRSDNVGKTSKMLLNTMKKSNSSCLKEHFGVPVWSLSTHQPLNPWTWQDTLKQERPLRGAGPHPALQERGRAIPAGAPAAPRPITMPPHVRPPPIPGMRPPLGSPGGPAPTPKSSMGFVMPIYTICIIVFFVYTLSKILFNRTGTTPYEPVNPDPQFRRRVFRDDSRTTPDKLVVTAISGLVAEVQQEMEASYAQNQQRQNVQENNARRYTNGTILHNSGPVHIVASEFKDTSKENSPENDKVNESTSEPKESTPEPKIPSVEFKEEIEESQESVSEGVQEELISEPEETSHESKDSTPEVKVPSLEPESKIELKETELEEPLPESEERDHNVSEPEKEITKESPLANGTSLVELNELITESVKDPEISDKTDLFNDEEEIKANILEEALKDETDDLKELKENLDVGNDTLAQSTIEFLEEEAKAIEKEQKQSTPELLEEAIKDDDQEVDDDERENASVKVVGMELTAHSADGGAWASSGQPTAVPTPTPAPTRPHEAEQVQSIFLDGAIPQQSRVLVERCEPSPAPAQAHSPMVVSGKMTLSLIQDAPRDTPERDPESTVDDFTTASAATQPAEKEEEESEEELEEEIEVEEIEEEIEVEEDEEEDEEPQKDGGRTKVEEATSVSRT